MTALIIIAAAVIAIVGYVGFLRLLVDGRKLRRKAHQQMVDAYERNTILGVSSAEFKAPDNRWGQ